MVHRNNQRLMMKMGLGLTAKSKPMIQKKSRHKINQRKLQKLKMKPKINLKLTKMTKYSQMNRRL